MLQLLRALRVCCYKYQHNLCWHLLQPVAGPADQRVADRVLVNFVLSLWVRQFTNNYWTLRNIVSMTVLHTCKTRWPTRLPTSLLCWLIKVRRDILRRLFARPLVCSNTRLNARPYGRSSAHPPHWNLSVSWFGGASLGTGPHPQCELSPALHALDTACTSTAVDRDWTNACSRLSVTHQWWVDTSIVSRYIADISVL